MTPKQNIVITFTRKFKKQYSKSDTKVRRSFESRLEMFVENKYFPILNNHELTGEFKGFRSINITGDWRAIYLEDKNSIKFVLLGTHSQLYK